MARGETEVSNLMGLADLESIELPTEDDLIEALREVHENSDNEYGVTQDEFLGEADVSRNRLRDLFGGWNEFLERAGIPTWQERRREQESEEDSFVFSVEYDVSDEDIEQLPHAASFSEDNIVVNISTDGSVPRISVLQDTGPDSDIIMVVYKDSRKIPEEVKEEVGMSEWMFEIANHRFRTFLADHNRD